MDITPPSRVPPSEGHPERGRDGEERHPARHPSDSPEVSADGDDHVEISSDPHLLSHVLTDKVVHALAESLAGPPAGSFRSDPQADPSAAATAWRIVDQAARRFDDFLAARPQEDTAEAATQFVDIVREAIEHGSREADSVFAGLGLRGRATDALIAAVRERADMLLEGFLGDRRRPQEDRKLHEGESGEHAD